MYGKGILFRNVVAGMDAPMIQMNRLQSENKFGTLNVNSLFCFFEPFDSSVQMQIYRKFITWLIICFHVSPGEL